VEVALISVSCAPGIGTVCRVLNTAPILAKLFFISPDGCRFAQKEGTMENHRVEELRAELDQLLKRQNEVLESRAFGVASDSELLEYEIRQEIIHEICNQLANSAAA
jgi:hypothetical protein